GPLVKGPLSVADNIAWVMGAGSPFINRHELGRQYTLRPPRAYPLNAQGFPEVAERVHWDFQMAAQLGVPGPYDYGINRIAWLGQLVTDWIGDAGELRMVSGRLERFNLVG